MQRSHELERRLPQLATGVMLSGPCHLSICLSAAYVIPRALGFRSCELASGAAVYVALLGRARTGTVMANGIVKNPRISGPGRNPQELQVKRLVRLQVVSLL